MSHSTLTGCCNLQTGPLHRQTDVTSSAPRKTTITLLHAHTKSQIHSAYYNNNNNNDRLTAFDPGQPG